MKTDRTTDSAAAERIRRAAIEAFAESGYGGSSTRQIAKRLNMSATAMYPHYRSKEELLYAIAMVFGLMRMVRGPSAQDRVLALDFLYIVGMLVMMVLVMLMTALAAGRGISPGLRGR